MVGEIDSKLRWLAEFFGVPVTTSDETFDRVRAASARAEAKIKADEECQTVEAAAHARKYRVVHSSDGGRHEDLVVEAVVQGCVDETRAMRRAVDAAVDRVRAVFERHVGMGGPLTPTALHLAVAATSGPLGIDADSVVVEKRPDGSFLISLAPGWSPNYDAIINAGSAKVGGGSDLCGMGWRPPFDAKAWHRQTGERDQYGYPEIGQVLPAILDLRRAQAHIDALGATLDRVQAQATKPAYFDVYKINPPGKVARETAKALLVMVAEVAKLQGPLEEARKASPFLTRGDWLASREGK